MPDALAHLASAALFRRAIAGAETRAAFYLGVIAPDVVSKTLYELFLTPAYFSVPLQTPLGWVPVAALLAFLLPVRTRGRLFLALLLGGWLHVALDALEYEMHGRPQLRPFAPFDYRLWGFEVFQNEWTVLTLTPALAAAVLLVESVCWGRRRGRAD